VLFTSSAFLFLFLPLFLLSFFLLGRKNIVLCVWSLLFYFYGEGWYIWILLSSILVAYLHGWFVIRRGPTKKAVRIAIGAQLLILGYFKYSAFLAEDILSLTEMDWAWPALPIGVSFFVFQAISYSMDVHRRHHEPTRSIIDLATYVSMFPQLIAGPIVRYGAVAKALKSRSIHLHNFNIGIYLFCIGLGQKVLIANKLAITADGLFGIETALLTTFTAWAAALSYTGQIYFDFAGYSNMAMGLGFILGFRFPRNFNDPYIAKSITEFWKRWHISLTSWFRDYVYIPLGGNRKGNFMTYRNLVLVFLLSGLWHGAAWTFVLWGAYHGFFLVIERLGVQGFLDRLWAPFAWLYMMLAVVFGWVLFRGENLEQSLEIARHMVTWSIGDNSYFILHSGLDVWIAMAIAVVLSTGLVEKKSKNLLSKIGVRHRKVRTGIQLGLAGVIFALCLFEIMASSYNPFIYFRF